MRLAMIWCVRQCSMIGWECKCNSMSCQTYHWNTEGLGSVLGSTVYEPSFGLPLFLDLCLSDLFATACWQPVLVFELFCLCTPFLISALDCLLCLYIVNCIWILHPLCILLPYRMLCQLWIQRILQVVAHQWELLAFLVTLLTGKALDWASVTWDVDQQVRTSYQHFTQGTLCSKQSWPVNMKIESPIPKLPPTGISERWRRIQLVQHSWTHAT